MHLDRPEGKPDETIGWGSDIAAEMLRRFNIPYISLNPGASFADFTIPSSITSAIRSPAFWSVCTRIIGLDRAWLCTRHR